MDTTGTRSYSTQYTYGPDSRPLTVRRNGVTSMAVSNSDTYLDFGEVDNLTFTYSGSHLVKVYDSAADVVYTGAADFCDAADLAVEYTYDANGNTTSDANKGITSIEYNALNLPAKITFADGSRMENTYSADGTLLRRYTNVSVTHTPPILHAFSGGIGTQLPHVIEASDDHIGPLTYHNGVLKRIDTPNGFIDGDGEIYYYVKDYQGNIRQVTDADGTVLQDNHYYPYGMLMAESSDILDANLRSVPPILSPSTPATVGSFNPYLYGGKEYLTFKGSNYLDFSARVYDNTTLTFGSPDQLREKYYSLHSYMYCAGNPVMFVDPTGKDYILTVTDEQIIISATYYVVPKDKESAQTGVDIINNQSGLWSWEYETSNGKIELPIIFDLNIVETSAPEKDGSKYAHGKVDEAITDAVNNGHYDGNNGYVLVDDSKWENKNGQTIYNYIEVKKSRAETETPAHEQGHTLGAEHYGSGLMTPQSEDISRSQKFSSGSIKEILSPLKKPNKVSGKNKDQRYKLNISPNIDKEKLKKGKIIKTE